MNLPGMTQTTHNRRTFQRRIKWDRKRGPVVMFGDVEKLIDLMDSLEARQ